jgi:hypothetical protein
LSIGDVVQTNYGTGPYRVIDIERDCTCPSYLDALDVGGDEAPRSAPHMHITCVESSTPVRKRYGERELRWLSRFVETGDGRIVNVWNDDELFFVTSHDAATMLTVSGKFYDVVACRGRLDREVCP